MSLQDRIRAREGAGVPYQVTLREEVMPGQAAEAVAVLQRAIQHRSLGFYAVQRRATAPLPCVTAML